RLTGEAVPLGGPVGVLGSTPDLAVSENSLLVYGAAVELQLTWVDRNGKALGVVGDPGFLTSPRLSSDGTKVIVRRLVPDPGFVIWHLMRGTSSRLISARTGVNWSPDSSEIGFDRLQAGSTNIIARRATAREASALWRR